ncbi:MAG: alpha/beta hydrolase family protein, partial [Planctomycetota bacterium]
FGCDPGPPPEAMLGKRDPALRPDDESSARRYRALRAALAPSRGRVRLGDLEAALASTDGGVLSRGTLLACVFEPQVLDFHLALGRDVDAEGGRLVWQDGHLPDLLSPAARKRYTPPWPVESAGEVTTRVKIESIAGIRVEEVRFPSPVRSGVPANDRVQAELYTPRDPIGALVQLPHWKEPRGVRGQRLLSVMLARAGFAVLLLPLPYQYERAPEGRRSGELTLSADLARTREAALQGAADAARASRWLEEARGFPPSRQGLIGTSLGGHVASLAMGAYPGRFAAGAFLLAGSHVDGALFRRNGVTDGILDRLEAKGVTPDEARPLVRIIDPAHFARPEARDRILLVNGDADPVVPKSHAEALSRAWGGARILWFSGGHYGVLRHLPEVLSAVEAHLRKAFQAP